MTPPFSRICPTSLSWSIAAPHYTTRRPPGPQGEPNKAIQGRMEEQVLSRNLLTHTHGLLPWRILAREKEIVD